MKKFEVSDFNVKMDHLSGEEKGFMEKMLGVLCEVMNKALDGVLSPEQVEDQFKSVNESLQEKGEKYEQIVKDNEELVKQVKSLSESIEKMKDKGLSMNVVNKFDAKIDEMLQSQKFTDFASGRSGKKSGVFEGFSLKDVTPTSMSSDYTGSILISQQRPDVVSQTGLKKLHVRDLLTKTTGEPEYPSLTFTQVYDMDRNARYVSENGRLPQSSIKAKEVTYATKRLGTFINISKRMLKSRVYLRSYILAHLPEAVWMAEDWNLLFGDDAGENLLGIANNIGCVPVETIISNSVVSGDAGTVKSVKSHNSGKDTIIEFTGAYDLILDGMNIKFTGAEVITDLNKSNALVKMNDRQILLPGVAFTNTETAYASMSWEVTNPASESVFEPNSEDVVRSIFAVMTFGGFMPDAIILNPMDVNIMESEKDTTGRNLGLVTIVNGVKHIAGRPIVEYAGMPAGKYLAGDFKAAAELVDYTSLTLEWAEDVESKLTNTVNLLAQEEIIFPVTMPWAFTFGSLAAVKAAIAVPAPEPEPEPDENAAGGEGGGEGAQENQDPQTQPGA